MSHLQIQGDHGQMPSHLKDEHWDSSTEWRGGKAECDCVVYVHVCKTAKR